MTSLRLRGGKKEEEEEEEEEVVAGDADRQEATESKGGQGKREEEDVGRHVGDTRNFVQRLCVREQLLMLLIIILSAFSALLLHDRYYGSQVNSFQRCDFDSQSGRSVVMYTAFTPPHHSPLEPFLDSDVSRRSLVGLLGWRTAASSWGWIPMACFSTLLPPQRIELGEAWTVLPDTTQGAYLVSWRYAPPPPAAPVEDLLLRLLSLLHPYPFLQSRYGPRGAVAVVRARKGPLLEILFRIHAEFQLNIPPRLPLWFTPAALVGRAVINSSDLTVSHCSIHVPATRRLNLDLEWLIGPNEAEDMEVSITHLPRMAVTSSLDPPAVKWSEEIPEEAALAVMERKMYRFMQVQYHNFSHVFGHAGAPWGKDLVHTVVLWGVLSDQSC